MNKILFKQILKECLKDPDIKPVIVSCIREVFIEDEKVASIFKSSATSSSNGQRQAVKEKTNSPMIPEVTPSPLSGISKKPRSILDEEYLGKVLKDSPESTTSKSKNTSIIPKVENDANNNEQIKFLAEAAAGGNSQLSNVFASILEDTAKTTYVEQRRHENSTSALVANKGSGEILKEDVIDLFGKDRVNNWDILAGITKTK